MHNLGRGAFGSIFQPLQPSCLLQTSQAMLLLNMHWMGCTLYSPIAHLVLLLLHVGGILLLWELQLLLPLHLLFQLSTLPPSKSTSSCQSFSGPHGLIPMNWMSLSILWGVACIMLVAFDLCFMGGNIIQGGFLTDFMGGLVFKVKVSVFLPLVQLLTTGVHTSFQGVFRWRFLLSSTVLVQVLLTHLMGGLHMRLHQWHINAFFCGVPAASFGERGHLLFIGIGLTMSFWPSSLDAAAPRQTIISPPDLVPLGHHPVAIVSVVPPLDASPPSSMGGGTLPLPPLGVALVLVLLICPAKPFKLPAITNSKSYLNLHSILLLSIKHLHSCVTLFLMCPRKQCLKPSTYSPLGTIVNLPLAGDQPPIWVVDKPKHPQRLNARHQ
jgi:hypothetical protein